jgi:hypothetical protein
MSEDSWVKSKRVENTPFWVHWLVTQKQLKGQWYRGISEKGYGYHTVEVKPGSIFRNPGKPEWPRSPQVYTAVVFHATSGDTYWQQIPQKNLTWTGSTNLCLVTLGPQITLLRMVSNSPPVLAQVSPLCDSWMEYLSLKFKRVLWNMTEHNNENKWRCWGVAWSDRQ